MATANSKEWKFYMVEIEMVNHGRLAPNTKATSGT